MANLDPVAAILGQPPRAARFIVTIYGDVAALYGGELGMAQIIAICAEVGISETLVRTAVSRLVAAGRLEGRKEGRRSFYRLTAAGEAEFAEASRRIYGPDQPCGWRLVAGPDALLSDLEPRGFARLRAGLALGPDRGALPEGAAVIAGMAEGDLAALTALAPQLWVLEAHAARYEAVEARFGGLMADTDSITPAQALALRLLLVDDFRHARLSDPALPAEALPANWPASRARSLFATLYQSLAPKAQAWLAELLEPSEAQTARLGALWAERIAQIKSGTEN